MWNDNLYLTYFVIFFFFFCWLQEYAIQRLDEYFNLKSQLPDDLRPNMDEENTPLYNGW